MKKINIDRQDITSAEIADRRNFQEVLSGAQTVSKPFYKSKWFTANTVLSLCAAATFIVYAVSDTEEPVNETVPFEAGYINPPLQGSDLPFEGYMVSADSASQIEHASGTVLRIPENAFVDNEGNTVDGEVELKYREMHNKADIFLSGVPMEYDSAGTKYVLESAGMIDIRGYKDGKEVFIAKGKEIAVDLRSHQPGTDYNLYELDTSLRNWQYRGKDTVTEIVNDAPDSKSGQDKAASVPYFEKTEQQLHKLKQELADLQKQKPVVPDKAKPDKWTFNIEVSADEFPELTVYKKTLWEVDESEHKFNPDYQNILWQNVLIKKSPDGISYLIRFESFDKEVSYRVKPVYEGTDYINAKRVYDTKFKDYTERLEKRKAEEKRLAEELKVKQEQWLREQKEANLKALENRLQWNSDDRYYNPVGVITRSFSVNNFGFWNCDRPRMAPKASSAVALFTDKNGTKLYLQSVYLVDKKMNTLFRLVQGYGPMVNSCKIEFDPESDNMIWAVTNTEKLAVLSYSDFRSAFSSGKKRLTVPMKLIGKKIEKPRDFQVLYDEGFTNLADQAVGSFDLVMNIAPNPSSSQITVAMGGEAKYTLQLYAINGIMVKQKQFIGTEFMWDISTLSQGDYVLRASWDKGGEVATSRLLKQ